VESPLNSVRQRSCALWALVLSIASGACSGPDPAPPVANWVDPAASRNGTAISGLSGSANGECAALSVTSVSSFRPIDVIFVIDNSASMDDEIAAVERSINHDFAEIMDQSGLDYRVILISRYGKLGTPVGLSDNPICVGPPLAGSGCAEPFAAAPRNGERFFHFSANVGSHDAWCVLLGGYDQPDEYADVARPGWRSLAPHGWSEYLREGAFKTFVSISDDEVDCQVDNRAFSDYATVSGGEVAAGSFDRALLKLSPAQFGNAKKRNYVWHSIAGMRGLSEEQPAWQASAPISTAVCGGGAEGPGTGYQALSRLSGGLRYPICDPQHYDALFNRVATGIVGGAQIACEWQIPEPPPGETFDRARVNVRHTPSGGGPGVDLGSVPSAARCDDAGGWYYDDPAHPRKITVCPSTCGALRRDPGRVDVLFGCNTQMLVR